MRTNDWSEVPDFLTVEEAACVMRIGRTAAYQLARHYLATGGKEGLPCVRVGKQLRVPRRKLEEHIGGPLTWPLDARAANAAEDSPASNEPTTCERCAKRRRGGPNGGGNEQPPLFE
ncbi:MAG: helix-turn-helix domain-containing protein [Acidimicrobiales bacterium]|nr:helix-turn-helix domain-containing protein [Acidimicrobiales bacterium]MCB9393276.1 helix-turn-helix domain-containing protein [Acidimicrobiaceae bacterium]